MTPRSIWLVRHGSTDWTGLRWCGRSDVALNATGRVEAETLAARLATVLDGPYFLTSPLLRARQTAEILAGGVGGRLGAGVAAPLLTVDPDLVEVDFGAAEGLRWSEIVAAHPAIASAVLAGRVDLDWPEGESAEALGRRLGRAWGELTELEAREVVVVTHGGVIRWLLRSAVGRDATERDAFPGPATAVQVVLDGGAWRVPA